ncbi:MAG TPA: helix-turn-helix transcriptional regulator [Niastella sp.]|nr:helix-turn-helix transcriptional regulator [Niastella sp.]
MRNNHSYSLYVRSAVANIKQQLDKNPFKYKTCAGLLESTSTVNRRVVEQAFKKEYGCRIKEYQVRQRLTGAQLFLLEGMPIKRVAAKCLYSSQSAFCRAFKKEFRTTPTDWLQSLDL